MPPGTGTWAAPTSRPLGGVMIAVCATTGPAARAKPEARLEAMKPRRVNGTFGRRLSRCGSSNLARSFILPPFGACGGLGSAAENRYSPMFISPWLAPARRRSEGAASPAARQHARHPEGQDREDHGRDDDPVTPHFLLPALGFGTLFRHQLREPLGGAPLRALRRLPLPRWRGGAPARPRASRRRPSRSPVPA